MTVSVDGGTVVNPQAFEGQLEGGMDQGVGYALREECRTFVETLEEIFQERCYI